MVEPRWRWHGETGRHDIVASFVDEFESLTSPDAQDLAALGDDTTLRSFTAEAGSRIDHTMLRPRFLDPEALVSHSPGSLW